MKVTHEMINRPKPYSDLKKGFEDNKVDICIE